ncbi:hypothetical protein PG985_003528 [Apiospora marii]|uniref:F-box domain-containing protein n=1 Tax=Apiospora marii TaxID=335849 RepID=A0ABR1SHV9_9PEZI
MATISLIHPYRFPRLGILELLHSRRGSPFERLPTEIIVDILLRLDELVSLDCLLHASPVAYRIFDEFAVQVTEGVLYNGYGPIRKGLHTQEPDKPGVAISFVPVQMYMAAMIRTGTLPLQSLSEFVGRVIMPYHLDHATVAKAPIPFAPRSLPEGISPAVVRGLVATSRHLTALSVDCLNFYLGRFRAIRPSHPIQSARNFDKMPTEVRENLDLEPWKDKPRGRKVPVQDVGPPTWLEEQRVLRAFWSLQIIVDLRKAASASRLGGWPSNDVEYHLQGWDATDVWSLEELLRPRMPRRMLCDILASSTQYRETMAVTRYLDAVQKHRWPEPEPQPPQRLEVRREGPAPRRRQHDLERLGVPSEAAKKCVLLERLSYTSLGRFAPYNALGFALWSDERMRAAQLLPSPSPPSDDGGGGDNGGDFQRRLVVYAWLSVLGKDDWRRLAEFRQEQRELVAALAQIPGVRRLWARFGSAMRSTEAEGRRFMQRKWAPYLLIDID